MLNFGVSGDLVTRAFSRSLGSAMFFFLVLGAGQGRLRAADGLYFFDLTVEPGEDRLTVSGKPQLMVTSEQLANEAYSFPEFMKYNFDSPIQSAVILLAELDRKRRIVFSKLTRGQPFTMVTFKFHFTVRKESGKALDQRDFEVGLALGRKAGQGLILHKETQIPISLETLSGPEGYRDFLTKLVFPEGPFEFKLPRRKAFLVDMYFSCKSLENNLMDRFDLDDKTAHNLLYTFQVYRVRENLGTTALHRQEGAWTIVQSGHLNFYRDTIRAYTAILEKIERREEITGELEAYLEKVPANFRALRHMVDAYLEEGRKAEADRLVAKYKPLFASSPEDQAFLMSYEIQRSEERRQLLQNRRDFQRDPSVALVVTSHVAEDLVAGRNTVTFSLEEVKAPVLQVDCLLNEDLVGSVGGPPYRIPFKVVKNYGRAELKLVAYFENETFQETVLPVKTMQVGQEQEVRLITLKAVVRGSDRFLLDLEQDDFLIYEGKERRPIHHFAKDKAPLTVAILVDTSNSMSGGKLYNAQYAVNNFLSKLAPSDRAAVFTFDKNVLKLTDFTNRYESIQPVMLTLSPHYSTALHQALLLAHQDLMKQSGTKVIIVLSDGKDSASTLSARNVFSTLASSSVMVYSIILNLEHLENKEGTHFMQEVSRRTGSDFMEVFRDADIDDSFDNIYRELNSFYVMSFYSTEPSNRSPPIQVKVKRAGTQLRFVQLLPGDEGAGSVAFLP